MIKYIDIEMVPNGVVQYKCASLQYRKYHCGDKTVIFRPYNLHNWISYTGKMASLYWISAQISMISGYDNLFAVTYSKCVAIALLKV